MAEVNIMKRKDKTIRIAASSVLLLAVVAAGVTMYTQERKQKEQEKTQLEERIEIGELNQNGSSTELSEGQEEAMRVTNSDAQAENTQELEENVSESEQEEQKEAAEQKENAENETSAEVPSVNEQAEDVAAQAQPALSFGEDSVIPWPVNGEVLIDYSMDATTYFPTLDQYKYNAALVLGAVSGEPVQAAGNGKVLEITENEETGTTLKMDLGNGYQAIYGQLKDLTVEPGQMVESGAILGYVNDPAKYYVKEGPNLYFAMTKDGKAIDPMIYLETVTE